MSTLQFPPKPPRVDKELVLQFPKRGRRRVLDDVRRGARKQPDAGEGKQRYSIQGKRAYETEWFLYQALLRLGWLPSDIQFQVGFEGGRNFMGGYIVDFILNTKPLPTPIWVHGDYWHSGEVAADDWLKQQRLQQRHPGQFATPVVFWGNEVVTEEYAFWSVMDKIGRL